MSDARTTIALDAMGGDFGPSVVVPAALLSLKKHPDLSIVLFGDAKLIKRELKKQKQTFQDRLRIEHTHEFVLMDESPASALRNKKKSSMRLAIESVKAREANACVSAGNTGALMAIARFVLRTLPGVDRPAIISTLPTINGEHVYVLDLGANVDCTPNQLLQFAIMGSVLANLMDKIESPRVALLNVGSEDIKGNDLVKATAELLKSTELVNFVGYTEGHTLFDGSCDVVVCDGFVGNVALKTCEGVIKLLKHTIRQVLKESFIAKVLAFCAQYLFKQVKENMDPDESNGANLIGLNGIVVKSHGNASVKAFYHAIEEAILLSNHQLLDSIRNNMPDLSEPNLVEGENHA